MPHDPQALNRRTFLGRSATAAAGVAVTAGLGASTTGCTMADSRYTDEYPDVPANKVKLPPNGKSVVLVGAGLSGLMAACELLDRGFTVTILEKNPTAGGRLRSWRDPAFGTPLDTPGWAGYPIEHGTHIVLNFYNNFREFLRRHGLSVRPRSINSPLPATVFAFPDGTIDDRHESEAPAPFHGPAMIEGLPALTAEDVAKIGPLQALRLMAFDPANPGDVAYLDSISAADWVEAIGMPSALVPAMLDPIMDMANFHPASRTSALYLLRFLGSMHGDWRDLYRVQFFQDSTQESIIDPLADYVRAQGGTIIYNAEVSAFNADSQRITGLSTKALAEGQYICPICGEIHDALPDKCRRCGWAGGGFQSQDIPERSFAADHYLLAVDIPGAKKILAQAPFASQAFCTSTQQLPTSSIVVVYLWYPKVEGQGEWSDHFGPRECLMTGGFPYLGTTLNLSVLKDGSFGPTNADIIETQIARTEWTHGLSDTEIGDRIDADLRALIPTLPRYTDLRIMRWDNFSTMTVGAEALRPAMQTPYKNFLILGDYNQLSHNCILMEKVTVNVKKAVNLILDAEGIAGARLEILPSETPNALVNILRKTCSVIP